MGALIFDFDGVIADSEAIANTVLAETVTGLGHSTTLDQSLARYPAADGLKSWRRSRRRSEGRCPSIFPISSSVRRWSGFERI